MSLSALLVLSVGLQAVPQPIDVLALAHEGTVGELPQTARARRARYEAMMASFATRPAPPDADEGVGAEIVRAARDHAAHPELARELFAFYVVGFSNPRARVPVSPEPATAHCAPRYRYAWEYLDLLPNDGSGAAGYGQSALEALAKIHDDGSLPLLVEEFKRTSAIYARDYSVATQIQNMMLPMLSSFVSERGLEAIVACASDMAAAQAAYVPPARRTDMRELVGDMVASPYSTERTAAWSEVIADYGRKPEHRARLATLRRLMTPASAHP